MRVRCSNSFENIWQEPLGRNIFVCALELIQLLPNWTKEVARIEQGHVAWRCNGGPDRGIFLQEPKQFPSRLQ
jgi:hypothetical protein